MFILSTLELLHVRNWRDSVDTIESGEFDERTNLAEIMTLYCLPNVGV